MGLRQLSLPCSPSEAIGLSPVPPPPPPPWGNGHSPPPPPPPPPVRQWAHVCVGWHWPKDCMRFYIVLSNGTVSPPTQSNSKRQWHLSLSCSPLMRQWAHASWPWPKDLMRFQMVLVYCRHSLINWWDSSELVGSTLGRWGRWLCWSPLQAAWTVSPGSHLLNPAYAEKLKWSQGKVKSLKRRNLYRVCDKMCKFATEPAWNAACTKPQEMLERISYKPWNESATTTGMSKLQAVEWVSYNYWNE